MPIPENIHTLPAQTYEPVPEQGLSPVLDIGGGGEGVVGLLCEGVCVSVDRDASELTDAPEGPLKIVSDATTLPFLDGSFPRARAFFSFMYMEETTKAAVLDEIFRVLSPGATLLIEDLCVEDDYPAEIVLVSEESICAATRMLLQQARMVVEPSGAVALAALQRVADRFGNQSVAVVLSGGNLDWGQFPLVTETIDSSSA